MPLHMMQSKKEVIRPKVDDKRRQSYNSALLVNCSCFTRVRTVLNIFLVAIGSTTITFPSTFSFTVPSLSSYSTLKRTKQPNSINMFTGIVEEIGTVIDFQERPDMKLWDGSISTGYELIVQSPGIMMEGIYEGCSICVSGVCLTVTEFDMSSRQFQLGVAPETVKRTYFATLKAGDKVNLERASEIGGRNSGHTVQGHVDCTATIVSKQYEGDSLKIVCSLDDPTLMPYIVPKGFIAIDGTSLTVIDVDYTKATFSFMLIAYTQKHIIIPLKNIGSKVNIEVDVMAKYAASMMQKGGTTTDATVAETVNTTTFILQRLDQLEQKVTELEHKLSLQNKQ